MKQDTLFKHKEFVVTYEELMEDAEEYWNLLNPPKKLKKTSYNTPIKKSVIFVIN
jgi:hypothetical protein